METEVLRVVLLISETGAFSHRHCHLRYKPVAEKQTKTSFSRVEKDLSGDLEAPSLGLHHLQPSR